MGNRESLREGYYTELKMFLNQAKTTNLKTKHFKSNFRDLEVKVSFGQGNLAKVPWISFLKPPNKTSDGIYPVYLLFKEQNTLILAYGLSETNKPIVSWNLNDERRISDFFKNEFDERPPRYGGSFIFKTYDLEDLPPEEIMDEDINQIIDIYEGINMIRSERQKSIASGNVDELELNYNSFLETTKNSGFLYSKTLIIRFIASLLTKPFVILTGLTGSGKTKLAESFVKWICQDKSQYQIIPVGADWTNRDPLFGYLNGLNQEEYIKPETGSLDVILSAQKNEKLPYFLILDEMNLSIVERYFADLLSTMETHDDISLHAQDDDVNGVPNKIQLPKNLFIIGTVNIDETTHMFSPKVLDRANTIEFRISEEEMFDYLDADDSQVSPVKEGAGSNMAVNFMEMSRQSQNDESLKSELKAFFKPLQKGGAEFGYRSASEILKLGYYLEQLDSSLEKDAKMDIAIMQKLLPKLHGSQRRLRDILETLGNLCLKKDTKIADIVKEVFEEEEFDFKDNGEVKYKISLEKITRMYKAAKQNGFTSFAEA